MQKYLFMACMSLLLAACSTQEDGQYYRTHPQALQNAVKDCPAKQPANISCKQLAEVATGVNELAYQLQVNPQAFGKKIIALQETLASQQANLKANPNQPELKVTVQNNEEQLAEYLAIVRWLESP
ncbi:MULTISPECIES: hypothetical protein [Legionella]|uniref:Secreted endonuclease n=1 Tax=Legionella drozanskii LLAP-1 TaxID=1212489 RepID=A0A0W0TDW6_9GAMM|nr:MULTISPECIES: hypothetical protein [Legionella]KTC93804.1 secreted endonuclease [Legionella drozanskii LLAP-1]PJE13539.1 MAG: hypothetical protein CK430_05935 [Legionella sp.]